MVKRTTFGELKRGDKFTLGKDGFEFGKCLNMKVEPSYLCDTRLTEIGKLPPFNVVSLDDGRVRTFHDEEKVWVEVQER